MSTWIKGWYRLQQDSNKIAQFEFLSEIPNSHPPNPIHEQLVQIHLWHFAIWSFRFTPSFCHTFSQPTPQGWPWPKLRVSLRSRRTTLHQGKRLQPADQLRVYILIAKIHGFSRIFVAQKQGKKAPYLPNTLSFGFHNFLCFFHA